MATIKIIGQLREENTIVRVYILIRHGKERVQIGTGIKIPAEKWDKWRCRVKGTTPEARRINLHLNEIEARAERLMFELSLRLRKSLTIKELESRTRREVLGDEPGRESGSFMRLMRHYCGMATPATQRVYRCTISRIEAFDPDSDGLRFEDITVDWLTRFNVWLSRTSKSQNYRNIHFRNIRTVINYAIANDMTAHYPFKRFRIRPEETRKRSLDAEELRRLFDYPCEPQERKYVDMFKLSFLLCGINIGDLCHIEKIDNGRIEYRRAKTGRLLSVKVEPEALEIIRSMRGKGQLLDVMDRFTDHLSYMGHLNKRLKQIGPVTYRRHGGKERHPLFPEITSYWARHSWATIAAELDVPDAVISSGLGHAGENRTTEIYIRRNRKKTDAANRRVIDWVLYGKTDGVQSVRPGTAAYYGLTERQAASLGLIGQRPEDPL